MSKNIRSVSRFLFVAISFAVVMFCACQITTAEPARKGKLHHIGLVWLKNSGNAAERQKIIDAVHSFARDIPEVISASAGKPLPFSSPLVDSTFDVCVVMQFEDQAALNRYSKHPVHQKAAEEVFLPLAKKIQFYDFISE